MEIPFELEYYLEIEKSNEKEYKEFCDLLNLKARMVSDDIGRFEHLYNCRRYNYWTVCSIVPGKLKEVSTYHFIEYLYILIQRKKVFDSVTDKKKVMDNLEFCDNMTVASLESTKKVDETAYKAYIESRHEFIKLVKQFNENKKTFSDIDSICIHEIYKKYKNIQHDLSNRDRYEIQQYLKAFESDIIKEFSKSFDNYVYTLDNSDLLILIA